MELTRKQQEGLKIAVSRYKNKEPYTVISGYAGTGKAQPNDTIIPTPNGNKKLGELKIGDYVFDEEGRPVKVLGIYPQGKKDVYKVTLKDGRTTLCCGEHLWGYYSQNGNLLINTTEFLLNRGLINKSGTFKTYLPRNKKIQFPKKNFQIDPYVIGAFLGDGGCTNRCLSFSSGDEESVAEISRLIGASSYVRKSPDEYTWYFILSEVTNTKKYYQTHDLFGNYKEEIMTHSDEKRIPQEYLQGSVEQRYSLLQGLMDTDGSINNGGYFQIRFTSISKKLIEDVQTLIYSLGYYGSITIDTRKEKYKTGLCYSLCITAPNEEKEFFFRLKRKKDIAKRAKEIKTRTRYERVAIVNIEKLSYQAEMSCIMVDNPAHLYLTNDYIVTHNTTLVNFITNALQLDPRNDIAYIAYTGQATQVLRSKGCPNAMTAHKLLYYSKQMPNGTYIYEPRKSLDIKAKLLIVDEVSMLPKSMWDLLLGHHVPVIACGDPGLN